MLRQIRVAGDTQRVIDAPEGDSLLQCGLRAGLNMPYHCENGRCGECRVRLLDGRVGHLFHGDFPFSERERLQGWILACASTAASDIELEIPAYDLPAALPVQEVTVRVRRLEYPQPERLILRLRCARSACLRFLAGQCVSLRIDGLGEQLLHLANCPCDAMHPVVHLARDRDDPFREHLFGRLKPGDNVLLRGPLNEFVLPPAPLGPVLLICWETGFAAVQSLLEQALALGLDAPLRIVWMTRDRSGRYLRNYCRSLVDAEELVSYQGADVPEPGLMAEALSRLLAEAPFGEAGLAETTLFAIVPPEAVESLRHWVQTEGGSLSRLKISVSEKL